MMKKQMVPDTYFIQEAVDLALDNIVNRLDGNLDYQPFFWIDLKSDPPEARHSSWDYCDMAGRYVDAIILARQMTGNRAYAGEEAALREFLLAMCNDTDGLFYNQKAPWSSCHADMFCQSRALMGLVSWYLLTDDEKIKRKIDGLVEGLSTIAVRENDYCYYPEDCYSSNGWTSGTVLPGVRKPGYGLLQLLPLMRYYEETLDEKTISFAEKLVNYFVYHSHVINENGSFNGYLHSGGIIPTAVGVLRYGIATNNVELISWAKRVCDWTLTQSSSFGWVPDGTESETCETCCITDMIHFMVKLAELGHHEYWGIIEKFTRNQLLENQIRDVDRIITPDAQARSTTDVAPKLLGSFDCGSYPNRLLGFPGGVEGCCVGAGVRALFLVWDRIVTRDSSGVYVNFNFSRSTEWVNVTSYHPYEGKITVDVHNAPTLFIRVPEWASRDKIRITVDDAVRSPAWHGSFLRLDNLSAGQTVNVQHPLRLQESEEIIAKQRYNLQWKGDTVIEISPKGEKYPIFQREHFRGNQVPLIEREYVLPPTRIHW